MAALLLSSCEVLREVSARDTRLGVLVLLFQLGYVPIVADPFRDVHINFDGSQDYLYHYDAFQRQL